MQLNNNNMCFACGKSNPAGLRLNFSARGEKAVAKFVPADIHQGWKGIMHGGLLATLLDEAMVTALHMRGFEVLTVSMSVKYRKPAYIGSKLVVTGKVDKISTRLVDASSDITLEDGTLIAEAVGRFARAF